MSADGPSTRRAPHPPIFTPTDIHRTLTQLVASCSTLDSVWVTGELINVSPKTRSGHLYFDLRDTNGSKLSCTLFGVDRVVSTDMQYQLVNGAQMVVRGSVKCACKFKGSQYQCNVREVQLTTVEEGVCEKQLAAWKRELMQEGAFEAAQKQPVPEYPMVVAIVTSDGGAALQDVKQTLSDARVPFVLRVYPCTVQGATCVASVLRQLDLVCEARRTNEPHAPDLVLVTRGGGSREDLWAFNDPALIRGINARRAVGHLPPIVCAIGHQVDTPLLDEACDRSYITPTYAAQALAKPFVTLHQTIHTTHQHFRDRLRHHLITHQQQCTRLAHAVHQFDFNKHVHTLLNQRHHRMQLHIKQHLLQHRTAIQQLHHQMATCTPWHALTKQTNLAVLKQENRVDDFDAEQFVNGKRGTVVLVTGVGEVVLHYRVGV